MSVVPLPLPLLPTSLRLYAIFPISLTEWDGFSPTRLQPRKPMPPPWAGGRGFAITDPDATRYDDMRYRCFVSQVTSSTGPGQSNGQDGGTWPPRPVSSGS